MPTAEPDYRQTNVTGSKWRRSCHGEFDNGFGRDGTTIGTPAGSTLREFNDPAAVLALRDPQTGALTGQTITHGELYAILWSLAMESAALQDAAAAAADPASAP